MPRSPTTYTYTDPRSFDGDEYEVADLATEQAIAALDLALQGIADADIMARNAELSRQSWAGEELRPKDWRRHPQGMKFSMLAEMLQNARTSLGALRRAVSYDPLHPPKE